MASAPNVQQPFCPLIIRNKIIRKIIRNTFPKDLASEKISCFCMWFYPYQKSARRGAERESSVLRQATLYSGERASLQKLLQNDRAGPLQCVRFTIIIRSNYFDSLWWFSHNSWLLTRLRICFYGQLKNRSCNRSSEEHKISSVIVSC